MIVAKGLGRSAAGASGIIAAAGLGLTPFAAVIIGGGLHGANNLANARAAEVQLRVKLEDRELLELVSIIVEVLNERC